MLAFYHMNLVELKIFSFFKNGKKIIVFDGVSIFFKGTLNIDFVKK